MTVTVRPLQARLTTVSASEPKGPGPTARDAAAYLNALLAADQKHLVDLLWAKHPTAYAGQETRAISVLEDLFSTTRKRLGYQVDVHAAGEETYKTVSEFFALSAYAHAVPRPDHLTAYDVAAYLNRVLSADQGFATSLVETRFPFDDSILEEGRVVIGDGYGRVGLLGLLNGLFRPFGQALLGKFDDDDRLVGFLASEDLPELVDDRTTPSETSL